MVRNKATSSSENAVEGSRSLVAASGKQSSSDQARPREYVDDGQILSLQILVFPWTRTDMESAERKQSIWCGTMLASDGVNLGPIANWKRREAAVGSRKPSSGAVSSGAG